MMKKIICLLTFLLSLPTVAQHQLDSVFVLVKLMDNGDARVTERRDAHMGEQGTEGFITFNNMGDIEVKDLQVWDDDTVSYTVEEQWNVERSREEKTHKCGYHYTDKGVEICWGIGRAGKRSYYISYTLTHLVKAYDDYDGFCHSFYEAANSPAGFAMVSIKLAVDSLTKKDARIWTFGYDGWKGHSGNSLWARTKEESPMRNGDAIIILVEFEKGLFHPDVKKEGTFKELVKRPAFVDSEYDIEVAMGDTLHRATRSSLVGGEMGSGHENMRRRRVIEDDGGPSWGLAIAFLVIVGLIVWAASGKIRDNIAHKRFLKMQADWLTKILGGKKWNELPY